MYVWMDVCMDGWMDGCVDVCMYGWMDASMDGWMRRLCPGVTNADEAYHMFVHVESRSPLAVPRFSTLQPHRSLVIIVRCRPI